MWLMIPTKTRPHKPMLAEWTSEILSLSLSVPDFRVQSQLTTIFRLGQNLCTALE